MFFSLGWNASAAKRRLILRQLLSSSLEQRNGILCANRFLGFSRPAISTHCTAQQIYGSGFHSASAVGLFITIESDRLFSIISCLADFIIGRRLIMILILVSARR
jgi:hypothetical protein